VQAPVPDSFKRPQNHPSLNPSANMSNRRASGVDDVDATFLTTDTSFVENPPSSKAASKFKDVASPARTPRKTPKRHIDCTRKRRDTHAWWRDERDKRKRDCAGNCKRARKRRLIQARNLPQVQQLEGLEGARYVDAGVSNIPLIHCCCQTRVETLRS
jgi:hypothetical protein